ncbi:MAG TPA: NAD(P)H-dependent oxidoreductase [Trinickia sp.]|jgi:FMN-dependent NADH-azoreductase|nr:NAD(P)H-dependent oxidoreductase [Trinickia sp.]
MTTLLHITASARKGRSLSRQLSNAFIDAWMRVEPMSTIISRDVGANPPPIITEEWIAAAFTPDEDQTPAQRETLRLSDELIDEIDQADVIVIGTPMYNYGMPAALKSWFDKVIRVRKTFTFDLARGDFPLEPVMSGKKLVILSSHGEFGFGPGGVREKMNHLETHILTCAHYLGVEESHSISISYQEFGDARHEASVADAFAAVPALVDQLALARAAA